MTGIIVFTLCLINLLLWGLLFKKFKKLFSTDDVIEKTRNELNRMIVEVNRNAERNITLIEARISDLKSIIAQADSHVSLLKSEIEKSNAISAYKSKIEKTVHSKNTVPQFNVEAYRKNSMQSQQKITSDSAFELTQSALEKNGQQNLFSDERSQPFGIQTVNVSEDGNSFKEVPVLGNNVHITDNPITLKKSFNAEVNERYLRGETVEEIAASLSRSVTEVQFALDMNE